MAGQDRAATRFDRWAATYERSALQPLLYTPVQQATLRLAADHLPAPRRILDVGCGTGALLRQAAQRFPGAQHFGIDAAGAMLTTASATTPAGLPIRFVHAVAERLPFADGVFDLAVSTLSFLHWSDQAAGLAQIRRVLAAGGVLALADVFAVHQRRTRSLRAWRRRRVELPLDIEGLLAANDLTVLGCQRLQGFPPICRVLVVVARTPGNTDPRPPIRGRVAAGPAARDGRRRGHQPRGTR